VLKVLVASVRLFKPLTPMYQCAEPADRRSVGWFNWSARRYRLSLPSPWVPARADAHPGVRCSKRAVLVKRWDVGRRGQHRTMLCHSVGRSVHVKGTVAGLYNGADRDSRVRTTRSLSLWAKSRRLVSVGMTSTVRPTASGPRTMIFLSGTSA
jgi:hypothetical protein